jgi:hypothetical protein
VPVRIQVMRKPLLTMRKLLLTAALPIALLPGAAWADGFNNPNGPTTNEGPRTLGGAAAGIEEGAYRYFSLTLPTRPPQTVVERIDKRETTIDRWWHLPGDYAIPAVAYDRSPGGLSADGGTLVLTTLPHAYPPEETRFAILDTRSSLRHRAGAHRAITPLALPGAFTFDAISPDGSRIYLIQYFYAGERVTHYDVRALDTATGRLIPGRIVDPEESEKGMDGTPITRLQSPDGRWAYTLYGADTPFLHALDTVRGRAVCVDLPQLNGGRASFQLRMRLAGDGNRIEVYRVGSSGGTPQSDPLLEIDTGRFEANRPAAAATPSGGGAATAGMPWLALAAVAVAIAIAIAWRRRAAR